VLLTYRKAMVNVSLRKSCLPASQRTLTAIITSLLKKLSSPRFIEQPASIQLDVHVKSCRADTCGAVCQVSAVKRFDAMAAVGISTLSLIIIIIIIIIITKLIRRSLQCLSGAVQCNVNNYTHKKTNREVLKTNKKLRL